MRSTAVALMALALAFGAADGQSGVFNTSAQRFTFADPSGVGIRSYAVDATTLVIAAPIGSRAALGAEVAYASAAMSPSGVASVGVSGLTDVELSVSARVGPARFRGAGILGTGHEPTTFDAGVVAGIAQYELLPLPTRTWGRGGGYDLSASLPMRISGIVLDVLSGTSSHGEVQPFVGELFGYSLGPEHRVGLVVTRLTSELSRFDVGAHAVFPQADEVVGASGTRTEVFEPGRRLAAFASIVVPLRSTALLVRGDVQHRAEGRYSGEPDRVPASAGFRAYVPGGADSRSRLLLVGSVETRTILQGLPPLAMSASIRLVRDARDTHSRGQLATLGVGSEIEVRGPWPGRLFVAPGAAVHTGDVTVADGYRSSVGAWELSLGGRWEAGR